jgi:hypothetical protein
MRGKNRGVGQMLTRACYIWYGRRERVGSRHVPNGHPREGWEGGGVNMI